MLGNRHPSVASIEDATGTGEMAGAAIAQETVVGFCEAEVDWELLQRKAVPQSGAMVLKAWSFDQQHQCHLGTC